MQCAGIGQYKLILVTAPELITQEGPIMSRIHRSQRKARWFVIALVVTLIAGLSMRSIHNRSDTFANPPSQGATGEEIFRYHTYGDEQLWTDQLRIHEVIESSLDPLTALALGLKVDADALPAELQQAILAGEVDLADPATTVALIGLDAVVGVVGKVEMVDDEARLVEMGISCALCHSTVDDSFLPGIGKRLDGWPNLDLDPGKIIAASPAVSEEAKAVYRSWGPGFYDPRFNIDGLSTPLVIPPAFGLAGVDLETYTGDGPISYWNNYVAVTQMGGRGSFSDPRLGINIMAKRDLVQPRLAALREYQLGLPAPPAPDGTFDSEAAERGEAVFVGAGTCASCHIPPLYTDVNLGMLHDPSETGMDAAYAQRTATKKYRTTPLRALWQHPPYFHDGSAATLSDVVEHYNSFLKLELSDEQKADLVEFLKSL
jgi:mono/diheme cytochrome c family protein